VRVSRYPRGFLDLVQAQTRGKALEECAEFLQPTIDVGPYLELGTLFVGQASTGVLVLGWNPLATLTADKLIARLYAASATMVTGGANSADFSLGFSVDGINVVHISDTVVQGVSQTRANVAKLSGPLTFAPNTRLGVWVSNLVGTPTMTVSYMTSFIQAQG
jgi:hypothetical protein